MGKDTLIYLFKERYHVTPQIEELPGGGSDRKYYRLSAGDFSVVGATGENREENEIFIRLDNCLKEAGINVPGVITWSSDLSSYLLEDLGDISLFELLKGEEKMPLAKTALEKLVEIQTLPEKIWQDKVGFPPFSDRLVSWDLNYFKYDFLKPASIDFNEEKLEDDFDKMREAITSPDIIRGFMYRDFQSRNIMVRNKDIWFIDFQGARRGPLTYDAVSFIWQAKAPFSFQEREELTDYYAGILAHKLGIDFNIIKSQMRLMEVFRTLQVMGAYGFRGLIEKKSHFLESIPKAVNNLEYLKNQGRLNNYPEVQSLVEKLKNRFLKKDEPQQGLTVTVYSFSYKKGYPDDTSGNGGGFMLDCRYIHNPGRYQEYKNKTGRDEEVIDFLEKTAEAAIFVENAVKIVSPSIIRYIDRGFTSLQVGFGCTGGQHRSVYCAELFAREIKRAFPDIRVRLVHREQKIAIALD